MAPNILRSSTRVLTRVTLVALASACHHAKPEAGAANPDSQRLGSFVGQPLLIAPVQSIKVAPELAWTRLPRTADILASLDRALADTLRVRVTNPQWVYADALVESSRNNPTYATDPHALSIQALKSPKLEIAQRLPEPLASQVRMMLALHEGRLVLIPVELRFERTATGAAHPVLHLVLVDPRLSDIRWFGDVAGDDLPTYSTAFAASIAAGIANLFVAK
jgi:hypothetical protein